MSRIAGPQELPAARGWHSILPALALLIFSLIAISAAALVPAAGHRQFAVIAPPWYGLDRTAGLVAIAGGRVVDAGTLSNVVIAYSEDTGFLAALYQAGALLVLDPVRLRGCLGFAATPAREAGA